MGGESAGAVGRADAGPGSDDLSIEPFLEGSTFDADGRIEISIFVSGEGTLEESELDVFLRQPRIDPGERIEIGVFVSGIDRVEENELSVFHGHEEVIDLEDPGVVRRNATAASDARAGRDGPTEARIDAETPSQGDYVHPVVFREGSDGRSDYALEGKTLDGNADANPAYIFELNTRAGAPPGEYALPIVFTYHSEDGVKQVKNAPSVHINDWRERWEPWLTRGVATLAFVTVVALSWIAVT
ncbi:hypothetical protein [Natronobacterium lacisalsi]|nr:hypothetical protein [Halobiforma lacisalsi]